MVDTVGAVLREQAKARRDTTFLSCGDWRMTFAEADVRADTVASGLGSLGVERGDRVAFVCPNRPEMLELFLGCARLGAIQVPLNAYLKGEFLRYQLSDSEASTLVVDAAGYASSVPLLDMLPELRRILLLDEIAQAPDGPAHVPYAQLLDAPRPPPAPELGADDLISIVYTSGTTGLPKGCMLPHGYYLRVADRMRDFYALEPDDVLLTALPMFHGAARMMIVTAALQAGVTAVVEPAFQPSGFIRRAVETGATIATGVGAMGMAVLAQPEGPWDREHCLRLAIWIPFPPVQQDTFERRFGCATTAELFGQTECVPVTYTSPGGPRNRASAGLPAPDLEVHLVDDGDREVAPGEQGEIVLRPRRPHAMFAGYWRKPDATLDSFRNLWYHTGDFGRQDEQGFITFVDRKKDAIRRRGENVSSTELELAIVAHPKVTEAAVHAVPSEMTEDDIKACIVLAPGAEIDPQQLFGFFGEHLPFYAIPRYVEILSELPKNAMARVMKHLLRERGITDATWDLEAMGFSVTKARRRGSSAQTS
jgi:crotonobetaine/carnitine-CoA ligase